MSSVVYLVSLVANSDLFLRLRRQMSRVVKMTDKKSKKNCSGMKKTCSGMKDEENCGSKMDKHG